MKFLRNWLRVERPAGVALNPVRTLELDADAGAVFDRCIEGIENVLGGHVYESDRDRGTVEAGFGLIHSERLTVSIERLSENAVRVRIEARRGAIAEQPRSSSYVEALGAFLQTPS